MLKPPLPNLRSSIRKKINESPEPVYIDNEQHEDNQNSPKDPSISTITVNSFVKLDNPIDMTACNALMDKKWVNTMKNSCLSLNKLVGETVHETHIGHENSTWFREVHRTQSHQHLDKNLVSQEITCYGKFLT